MERAIGSLRASPGAGHGRQGPKTCPMLEIDYDRSRHVIQITQQGEKKSEFEDQPARLLFMERDPETAR